MKTETRVAPPNSIVFLTDGALPTDGSIEVPEVTREDKIVWATPTCVVVGTLCEVDGESHLVLSDESPSDKATILAYESIVETPSKELALSNAQNELLVKIPVPNLHSRVNIWVNDTSEPDEIYVLIVS